MSALILKHLAIFLEILANLFTVLTGGIAVYLFLCKRKTIATAFKTLMSYAWHATLTELRDNIEELSRLNVSDSNDCKEAVCVLGEIIGQIKGNRMLSVKWRDISIKLNRFVNDPAVISSESRKRALTSELRERLRHLSVEQHVETWEATHNE